MELPNPRVSVIVPCFNNGLTIDETISSVLAQTESGWELICVDDGSSDDTCDHIRIFCEKDKRIRLVIRNSEPKGGAHCRNIGAENAQGDFLIFLDGDDILVPTCLEKRLRLTKEDELFSVFPMGHFNGGDSAKGVYSETYKIRKDRYKYLFTGVYTPWQVTSPIWKTSFFNSLRGFDVGFKRFQDVELHLRAVIAAKNVFSFHVEQAPDCFYRIDLTKKLSSHVSLNQEKINRTIDSIAPFYHLICDSSNDLKESPGLFSLSVLSFLLFSLQLTNGQRDVGDIDILDNNLLSYLKRRHRYFLDLCFLLNKKIMVYYIRIIRKIIYWILKYT